MDKDIFKILKDEGERFLNGVDTNCKGWEGALYGGCLCFQAIVQLVERDYLLDEKTQAASGAAQDERSREDADMLALLDSEAALRRRSAETATRKSNRDRLLYSASLFERAANRLRVSTAAKED